MNKVAISSTNILFDEEFTFTIAVLQVHYGYNAGMANGIVRSSTINADAKPSASMLSMYSYSPTCVS